MAATHSAPLNSVAPLRRTTANRLFALFYTSALLALFYRHIRQIFLLGSASTFTSFATLNLLVADAVLALLWCTKQSFRMYPIRREEYVENIPRVIEEAEFPALDVFVCTADPYKEPPVGVVNTALSVMAYEYPKNKLSIYISDDGGSKLTLFAFMEAAKFAAHWLPFCQKNKVLVRSPEDYFMSNQNIDADRPETETIKMMYEEMKASIENVVAEGNVREEFFTGDEERRAALSRWTDDFTRQNHPPVIQVMADNSKDRDIDGNAMPNLIYLSRGKSRKQPHHFKAGALNALVRVSGVMTNAPIIMTLDCDMRSNDPGTARRVLCYFADPDADQSELAYVQFPQFFQGLNKHDIYAGSYMGLFHLNPIGMKNGPNYVGTGCFFRRRAFFGAPTAFLSPEIPELSIDHRVDKPIQSQEIMDLAHRVATCDYENMTTWGYKIGFRYGSLVEDYFTGFLLQCEGWKSIFCSPDRPAFLGDAPTSLIDMLNQCKRWVVGLHEVTFSRYSVMIYGVKCMGLHMALAYAHYAFWGLWSIPILIYSLIPQLALLNGIAVFPKVSEPWFGLYVFLFIGAYCQDMIEFVMSGHGATVRQWWNEQRSWLIRGLTCHLFGSLEFTLKLLGISSGGFDITSKANGNSNEQSKRYEQGVFDFGASSPMFLPLSVAALVNLAALVWWLTLARGLALEQLVSQVVLTGFGVANGLPLYEAMFLRSDNGRLPINTTMVSVFVASLLCIATFVV